MPGLIYLTKHQKNATNKTMKRSLSQTNFYTQLAKQQGYPARSVFKLKEIQDKYRLFNTGNNILDLGCAPGSWLVYLSNIIGPKGRVIGLDLVDVKIKLPANVSTIKTDINDNHILAFPALQTKFVAVVSDLAPHITGIKETDTQNSLELWQTALKISQAVLKPQGKFICKMFDNEFSEDFIKQVKKHFKQIRKFRPQATPKSSREFYVVAGR